MKNYCCNLFLLFIVLHCLFKSYPQDKALDSLKQVLHTQKNDTDKINTLLQISYHFDKSQEGRPYADQALVLAKKLNDIESQAWANNQIGRSYYFQHNDSAALRTFYIALKLGRQTKNLWAVYNTWLGIVDSYRQQGKYTEAVRIYYDALKVGQQTRDQWAVYNSMLQIGNTYKQQGNFVEALKHYHDALKVVKQLKGEYNIFDTYRLISEVYKSLTGVLQGYTV